MGLVREINDQIEDERLLAALKELWDDLAYKDTTDGHWYIGIREDAIIDNLYEKHIGPKERKNNERKHHFIGTNKKS
jgi:hypothetical protein